MLKYLQPMKRLFSSLIFLLIILVLFIMPMVSFGQDPPGGGCDPFDPLCPIDGGLSLLIAAGIGLGAKKAYQESKKLTALKD